ncbi:hypothetical protein Trydic_g21583 [Trypoxylus dichotomus]
MWAYRRMLRIPWTKYVTNVEVLRKMDGILQEVKNRKLQYLGHIMGSPKYDILHLIVRGKMWENIDWKENNIPTW